MNDRRYSFKSIGEVPVGLRVKVDADGKVSAAGEGDDSIGECAADGSGWCEIDLDAIPTIAIVTERIPARMMVTAAGAGHVMPWTGDSSHHALMGMALRPAFAFSKTLILPMSAAPATAKSKIVAAARRGVRPKPTNDFLDYVEMVADVRDYDLVTAQIHAEQMRPDLARQHAAAGGKLLTILPAL